MITLSCKQKLKCSLSSSKELMKMSATTKIRIQNKTRACIQIMISKQCRMILTHRFWSVKRPFKLKLTILSLPNSWISRIHLRWRLRILSKLLCSHFKLLISVKQVPEVFLTKICCKKTWTWNLKKSNRALLILSLFLADSTIKDTLASMSTKPNMIKRLHLYVTIRSWSMQMWANNQLSWFLKTMQQVSKTMKIWPTRWRDSFYRKFLLSWRKILVMGLYLHL